MSSEEMKTKTGITPIEQSECRLHELRRYRFGELAANDRERVRAHLEACAPCRTRLAAIEEEERAFLAKADVGIESARILEKLEAAERRLANETLGARIVSWLFGRDANGASRLQAWRPALVFALVLLFVAPLAIVLRPHEPTTRIKGSASEARSARSERSPEDGLPPGPGRVGLELYVNGPAGPRRAGSGERLKQGDQIQFRYRAAGKRYVFVVSVAGGALDPLYPDVPDKSIPVTPDGVHVLEGSIILDEARGPERIFAFFSDRPLGFEEVKSALEKKLAGETDITSLREVDLGREDVDEATVLIVKE